MKHYLNKQTLLNMYYSVVFPYLLLKKKKNKCVRIITFTEFLAPSEPIFQSLNVLNFEK